MSLHSARGPVVTLHDEFACSAYATVLRIMWGYIRVAWGKLVASFAMSYNAVDPNGSLKVHAMRDGLQMIRVYALAIAAQMVNFQPNRYWTLEQFIGHSVGTMRAHVWATSHYKRAIALGVQAGGPLPTSGLCFAEFTGKSLFQWNHSEQHNTAWSLP